MTHGGLLTLFLLLSLAVELHGTSKAAGLIVSREDFPPGFVFGAGTSAYQIEGAAQEDGRKPSIWDTFAHSGKTLDQKSADVTADQYHKYKDDVKLMYEMGLEAYRFSISWSRLIPDGRGAVNPKGLQYYNNLINELIRYGIEPHVTLNHFDPPQALEDEYGSYLSPKLIEDFTAYADVCFKEFGDRVKRWITFNEPNIQTIVGYDVGVFPPGRCSPSLTLTLNCSKGSSASEVYVTAHNILLAHGAAVHLYREKYQPEQKGLIGITILAIWFEPLTNSTEDIMATKRVLDFQLGWIMDPLVTGDYPPTMRKITGPRLPLFSKEESKRLKGSFDFVGLNHYSAAYVSDFPYHSNGTQGIYMSDISAKLSFANGQAREKGFLWLKTALTPPAPWALPRMLEYFKYYYKNPAVFIHENGYGTLDFNINTSLQFPSDSNDMERVDYLQKYIKSLLLSVRNGSNTRGYFVWSLMDCFELTWGYEASYGIIGVDFQDKDRRRYSRLSAKWYASFLQNRGLRSSYLYSQ